MEPYPYFIYPAIVELKTCKDPERIARLKEFIATNVGEREALYALIGDPDDNLKKFYHSSGDSRRSEDASIDSFIAKFGGSSLSADIPLFQEEITLSPLLSDNSTRTEKISEESPLSDDISSEKVASPTEDKKTQSEVIKEEQNGENELERVKILVKNRKYEEALAIMEDFYLNNPKKSVYFADQIRFIRKMMLNERKK